MVMLSTYWVSNPWLWQPQRNVFTKLPVYPICYDLPNALQIDFDVLLLNNEILELLHSLLKALLRVLLHQPAAIGGVGNLDNGVQAVEYSARLHRALQIDGFTSMRDSDTPDIRYPTGYQYRKWQVGNPAGYRMWQVGYPAVYPVIEKAGYPAKYIPVPTASL